MAAMPPATVGLVASVARTLRAFIAVVRLGGC